MSGLKVKLLVLLDSNHWRKLRAQRGWGSYWWIDSPLLHLPVTVWGFTPSCPFSCAWHFLVQILSNPVCPDLDSADRRELAVSVACWGSGPQNWSGEFYLCTLPSVHLVLPFSGSKPDYRPRYSDFSHLLIWLPTTHLLVSFQHFVAISHLQFPFFSSWFCGLWRISLMLLWWACRNRHNWNCLHQI
jgi:hypothetical protein